MVIHKFPCYFFYPFALVISGSFHFLLKTTRLSYSFSFMPYLKVHKIIKFLMIFFPYLKLQSLCFCRFHKWRNYNQHRYTNANKSLSPQYWRLHIHHLHEINAFNNSRVIYIQIYLEKRQVHPFRNVHKIW